MAHVCWKSTLHTYEQGLAIAFVFPSRRSDRWAGVASFTRASEPFVIMAGA